MAISAFGTLLKIGDGAGPEVFTTVAEVKAIGGPTIKVDTVDLTTHSSSGAWREFLPTLIDAGELTFDVNFLPTNATHSQSTGLLKDLKNRTKRNWQLVFPDAGSTTWAFAAYVTGFQITAPPDDLLGASVTLRLTGQPTLAG
jgi:predicted secreted protein